MHFECCIDDHARQTIQSLIWLKSLAFSGRYELAVHAPATSATSKQEFRKINKEMY
jgi:hypothetical protein